VRALSDVGLFSMLVPRSVGGAELDLPTYVRAIEELARADASVAWCVGQGSGLCLLAAFMEPETAREVFVDSSPAVLANGPGERNEPARAVPVAGGYRVSGRWNFASGIRHATWLSGISQIEGEQIYRFMLFRKEQAQLIDTWQVSGLRGTGSFSFSVNELFVPEAHSVVVDEGNRRERGPLYLFSSSGIFGPSFGSVALGIAHSALHSFLELAGGKTPRGADRTVRDSETVQAMVARSQARLTSARLLLHHTLTEVWDDVSQEACVTTEQRVHVRLAATNATHEAADVVDAVYKAAGSTAIFAAQPFERRFRDIHAVTQQLQARAAHFETVGRFLLGLDPDQQFL
jgi:indole-3-acetate monooxygenase